MASNRQRVINETYDVRMAFARIEDELIASMMRNLAGHLKDEDKEGFDWLQWQAGQLRLLNNYRRNNQRKYGRQFDRINAAIERAIRDSYAAGQKKAELEILKAIAADRKIHPKPVTRPTAYFNGEKLEALVKATRDDMTKAEYAVLRRVNDQYRKIIFDAQMYANTGAATIEKAVDMATKDFLSRGIDSIQYKNGARHTISDYADMAIRTSEKRAYLMGEGQKRQEWNEPLVIVNRRGTMSNGNYGTACRQCIPWLGKVLVDDVYSDGKPDGEHKTLSEAMAAGFLHPRCKDSVTTYIPGIGPHIKPITAKEAKQAAENEAREAKEQYIERKRKSYERLATYSLDADNKAWYNNALQAYTDKNGNKN